MYARHGLDVHAVLARQRGEAVAQIVEALPFSHLVDRGITSF